MISTNGFKVLIIDDSIIARMTLKKLISERNYNIIEAKTSKEGLDFIESIKPDIIISDYLMPEMDGLELLKIIRGKGISTPVIIVSANQQESTRNKFIELGITGIIKKHPDKQALLSLIDQVINKNERN